MGIMKKLLFVLNETPYGSERTRNGLRHALAVAGDGDAVVKVFLIGDATTSALAGQKTREGDYSIERLLEDLIAQESSVAL